jgi:LmbE family N-acetylglucosaminyl deacetylase
MNSTVLIVAAHLDDFELGMGGTTAKLAIDNDVHLLVLCRGDRPGASQVATTRKDTCERNCNELKISHTLLDYSDTMLDRVSQTEICSLIGDVINETQPSVVYTHHEHDVHKDHQIVSVCTKVACRMRRENSVRSLYEFFIPGSSDWSFKPKHYNTYHDITLYADIKMKMINRYTTELRQSPDPMSMHMINTRDVYHGSLCGMERAEVFNQVFRRC